MRRRRFLQLAGAAAVVAAGVGTLAVRLRDGTEVLSRVVTDHFDIHVTADGVLAWRAKYLRTLPFAAGVAWVAGDRCAYKTCYAFLTFDDRVVGRVTFARVAQASGYVVVNDKYMAEGQRFYDGTVYTGPAVQGLGDCPDSPEGYEASTGPWDLPTINYEARTTTGTDLLEVRDYKVLAVGAGITFRQVESSPERVTVVAYKNGTPITVVYYDSMVPDVVMTSDVA